MSPKMRSGCVISRCGISKRTTGGMTLSPAATWWLGHAARDVCPIPKRQFFFLRFQTHGGELLRGFIGVIRFALGQQLLNKPVVKFNRVD